MVTLDVRLDLTDSAPMNTHLEEIIGNSRTAQDLLLRTARKLSHLAGSTADWDESCELDDRANKCRRAAAGLPL